MIHINDYIEEILGSFKTNAEAMTEARKLYKAQTLGARIKDLEILKEDGDDKNFLLILPRKGAK